MKTKICWLWLFLLLTRLPVCAQHFPAEGLGEHLFPPELLVNFQSEIGLTSEQRDAIVATLQKTQPQFEEKQRQLQKETEKLNALLRNGRVDMETVLPQLDRVLNLEKEIKRAHLAMVIGMKNKLSPAQQAKLNEIKKQIASGKQPPSVLARLEAKMEKVKAGAEQWQNDGRDPSSIGEVMQELEPLMKAGKFKEAEAVLDTALRLLGASKDAKRE